MIRTLFAALLTIALPCLVSAQSLPEFEKKLTEFTLPNGLHFIIVERHEAPVVAFNSLANVGAVDDPSGKTGLAHMFEHMAFKGTPAIGSTNWTAEKAALEKVEHDYDALQNERNRDVHADKDKVQQLNAALEQDMKKADAYSVPNLYPQIIEENGGEGLNAQTGSDYTDFFYKLPSNRIELWFLMESQRFYEPAFREFYKERSVVREERRMRTESEPQGLLVENFTASAFEAHPYHNPPVGWASDIENLRVADAVRFFKRYYVPANLCISIVGDVDPKEAHRLADKYFGMIPPGPNPPPVTTVEPVQEGERSAGVISPAQPLEFIGYKRPDERSPDDTVLEVAAQLLSGGRTGIIYKDLVRDKRLALAAGADSSFPGSKYPHLFFLYIVPNQGRSLADCEKPLLEIIEKFKHEKVDDASLQRVKAKLRAALINKLDSNAELASELNQYYFAYGDWRKLFTQLDELEKVTSDDVMRVANKYFIPETRTVARLMPGKPQTQGQPAPTKEEK